MRVRKLLSGEKSVRDVKAKKCVKQGIGVSNSVAKKLAGSPYYKPQRSVCARGIKGRRGQERVG
jgi:hypothetical protein